MEQVLPLVTIAIPTYNRADRFLGQALGSAVNQTYQNLEIIVADNCSTDNTHDIVKGFKDPRIQYFKHSTNIGANNNLNWCANHAKGAFVLMLHDDDLIDGDCIESCMKAADFCTDVGIIRTGTRVIDSEGRILSEQTNIGAGLSIDEFITAFLSRRMRMFLCGSLFNTKRLREVGGFRSPHNCWGDVHTEFQLAARFGRVDVPAVKGSLRKHCSATTYIVDIRKWIEDSLFLLDALCDLCPEKEPQIRKQGMWYFASHCYDIARESEAVGKRLVAYVMVFKTFKSIKELKRPSLHSIRLSLYSILFSIIWHTPLYYPLKFVKMKINRVFART